MYHVVAPMGNSQGTAATTTESDWTFNQQTSTRPSGDSSDEFATVTGSQTPNGISNYHAMPQNNVPISLCQKLTRNSRALFILACNQGWKMALKNV